MFQKVKDLFLSLTIYGVGDVATQLISFLLLPLYVRFLSPNDYGILALLLTVEIVAKVVFRWGVDASFMRFYYDCGNETERRRLASTIFFFLLAMNGGLLLVSVASAPLVADGFFGVPGQSLLAQLVLVTTFINGFFFIPFHVMRIQNQPRQFSLLTFSRSVLTLVMRLVLVVGAGRGVFGVVLADLVVAVVFVGVLAPRTARLIRPVFSRAVLKDTLRFGLPRVPHGLAQQMIGPGTDAYLLRLLLREQPATVALRDIGLYSIGSTFGLGLKLFLSAFEYAWAPFYFSTMKEPDAKETFSLVATYGIAVLVLLTTGLSAVAPDLVRLMTKPQFYGAARVIPWIALGVTFQGVYVFTSIGLNITKHTEYYPLVTGITAAVNLGSNMLLIPRFGIMGPAWSNTVSYGVLAVLSIVFSGHFYPIRYEWGRLLKIALSGVATYLVASLAVPHIASALLGLLARGSIVLVGFPALLALLRFYEPRETARLGRIVARFRRGRP